MLWQWDGLMARDFDQQKVEDKCGSLQPFVLSRQFLLHFYIARWQTMIVLNILLRRNKPV